MTISAELVKQLRERTGSGMMECKKALVEANGDIDLAAENLRKTGAAKVDKKASNVTAEGIVLIKTTSDNRKAIMLEINCQTDFVAKGDSFRDFANAVALQGLTNNITDVEQLLALPAGNGVTGTFEDQRRDLISTLGENIQVRRAVLMQSEGIIGTYLHGDRIGVMVDLSTHSPQLGKDLAMHIAASRPRAIAPEDISNDVIEKEREIFMAQAQGSGKPIDIIEKMVEGRIKKFLSEETLLGQPFVKDPSKSVEALLKAENAKVIAFVRFEVGEGIERKTENFAEEVMAQVRGSE